MNEHADPVADFDHGSPEYMRDPLKFYQMLREQCPVAKSEKHGGFYVVSRYDDVKRVFQDFDSFSSTSGSAIPPQPVQMYPIDLDPPESTKYRRILNPFFAADSVNRHRDRVQTIIDDLLDAFIERGNADIASELIRPMLPAIVLPMIGVRSEDSAKVVHDIDVLTRRHKFSPEAIGEAFGSLTSYLLNLIQSRRHSNSQDDVIGLLLSSSVDGAALSNDQIFRTIMIVLFGGLDTTSAAMLEALNILGRSETQKSALKDLPDFTLAIEEIVRFASPVQGLKRTAKDGVSLGDKRFDDGDRVFALLGSANRDASIFERPNDCIFSRTDNPHLGFGIGAHICLGRNLARLEIELLLRTVLARIPDFSVDPAFEPDFAVGETRGMLSLPIVFTPGARKSRQ